MDPNKVLIRMVSIIPITNWFSFQHTASFARSRHRQYLLAAASLALATNRVEYLTHKIIHACRYLIKLISWYLTFQASVITSTLRLSVVPITLPHPLYTPPTFRDSAYLGQVAPRTSESGEAESETRCGFNTIMGPFFGPFFAFPNQIRDQPSSCSPSALYFLFLYSFFSYFSLTPFSRMGKWQS